MRVDAHSMQPEKRDVPEDDVRGTAGQDMPRMWYGEGNREMSHLLLLPLQLPC